MFDRPLAKGSIAASPQPPKMPKVVFPGGYLYIYLIHRYIFPNSYFSILGLLVPLLNCLFDCLRQARRP